MWPAGIDRFDAEAFRLAPAEATAVDPQVRVLMEETAAAWGDARPRLADPASHVSPAYHSSYPGKDMGLADSSRA